MFIFVFGFVYIFEFKQIEMENEIFANLTIGAKSNGHFTVYNHETVPKHWNVNNEQRMGPIFAVADIKYAFQDMFDTAEFYRKKYNVSSKNDLKNHLTKTIQTDHLILFCLKIFLHFSSFFLVSTVTPTTKYGAHGYDTTEESMHAIFMAKGPHFPVGAQIPSFNTVDLYNLFCSILDIKCTANDGTIKRDKFEKMLKNPINRLPSRYQQIVSMIENEYEYYTNTRK